MRAKPRELPDGLWEGIEPLLPVRQRRCRYPGRLLAELHPTGQFEWEPALAHASHLQAKKRGR